MSEVALPEGFLLFKEKNPEFFPDDQPIEKQVGYYKAMRTRHQEQHDTSVNARAKANAALDDIIALKKAEYSEAAAAPKTEYRKPTDAVPLLPAPEKKNGSPVKKNGSKGRKGNDETPEYKDQPRGWFEYKGNIYLEVIDTSHEFVTYYYATVKDGKISFVDELIVKDPIFDDDGSVFISGVKYVPRKLIENKDGQPIHNVLIPEKSDVEALSSSDMQQIKEDILNHISKYCELPPNDMDLCVFYIISTWFYPKLSTIPYLRFRADTGKGKSRILKTISDLCFYPVKAGGASTAAGTLRFAEFWHGTVVIDEADIKGEADDSGGYTNDMIKYLNLGFEKGQYFIKSDKVDPKKQEVFDPFCPKVIAMRGVFQDPATEGRCLSISPSETERKDIPAILPVEYNTKAAKIRAALMHYTLTHWDAISDADPYPSFNDVDCEHRLKQLGSPLARVLSKVLPDGLDQFKHYVERRQVEVKADRAASFVGNIVNILYDNALESDAVYSSTIADAVGSSTSKVTKTLKEAGFGIEQRRVVTYISETNSQPAKSRTTVRKVVVVNSSRDWREIARRYIVCTDTQSMLSNNLVACPVSIRSKEYVEN